MHLHMGFKIRYVDTSNANMFGIGVATGHYSKTELKSKGAATVFDV